MTRTLIDVDDEALAMAMVELQTGTKVETVNRALREVAARRQAKVDRFMETALMISEALNSCDVRAEGWR